MNTESVNTESVNTESVISTPKQQIINVDTEPSVKFAEVNTIIDIEPNNEDNDDLIQIMDGEGEDLNDFENLGDESIEYETLN